MLSKVSSTISVTGILEIKKAVGSFYTPSNDSVVGFSVPTTATKVYVKGKITGQRQSNNYPEYVYFTNSGTKSGSQPGGSTYYRIQPTNAGKDIDTTINKTASDTIYVWGYSYSGYSETFTYNLSFAIDNVQLSKNGVPVKPLKVNPGIGEKTNVLLFGNYNNDFYMGITKTDAQTIEGNITPKKFVGYLRVGPFIIPYYEEKIDYN